MESLIGNNWLYASNHSWLFWGYNNYWLVQDAVSSNESIKITVRFLSKEVQSNSIKVIVHNKKCKTNENCAIDEIDSNIKFELQKSILAKAAQFERESKKSKK